VYKLGYDKTAAPRWAKMLAAGKLSPAAVERLKGMKGLKPRQIGKAPLAEGVEKVVRRGFAGDDVGPAVIKRIKQDILPGASKEYLELASKHPDIFNAPIAVHEGGRGWTEKALSPISPMDERVQTFLQKIVDRSPQGLVDRGLDVALKHEVGSKSLRRVAEGIRNRGRQIVPPALGEHVQFGFNPAGKVDGKTIYDLHAGNVMFDEAAGVPKIVDALVPSPRVKARQAIQKYGPKALSAAMIGVPAALGAATSEKKEDRTSRALTGAGLGLAGTVLGFPRLLSGLLGRGVAPVNFKM